MTESAKPEEEENSVAVTDLDSIAKEFINYLDTMLEN